MGEQSLILAGSFVNQGGSRRCQQGSSGRAAFALQPADGRESTERVGRCGRGRKFSYVCKQGQTWGVHQERGDRDEKKREQVFCCAALIDNKKEGETGEKKKKPNRKEQGSREKRRVVRRSHLNKVAPQ